jgi:hypothetical protein
MVLVKYNQTFMWYLHINLTLKSIFYQNVNYLCFENYYLHSFLLVVG